MIAGCSNDNVTNNTATNPSPTATTMDAKYASDWIKTLYRIMSDQQPNPQKCSRTFSYVAVGMYEAIRNGIPNSRLITTADPSTSARSHAAIATSVLNQLGQRVHFG